MVAKVDPTDPKSAGSAGVSETQAAAGRRLSLSRSAGLAVLFAIFILAWQGGQLLRHEPEPDEEDGKTPVESKNPVKTVIPGDNPIDLLVRGDQAMRQHRFALALSHFDELRVASTDHVPLIDYRLALCNEWIGQLNKAIAGYRTSISGAHTPAQSYACHLGLARRLFRQGQYADARRLLYPFLLDNTRQKGMPRSFLADTRYLIALSLAREVEPQPTKSSDEEPISISAVGLETPNYLDEAGAPGKASEASKNPEGSRPTSKAGPEPAAKTAEIGKKDVPLRQDIVVRKKADNHPLIVVKKLDVHRPAIEVFDLLAAESGTAIQLSIGAKKSLADRSLRLCVQNWLLDDLLEPVAEYHDLVFWVEGEVRHISTPAELDAKLLKTLRLERSGRALRAALVAHAGHPWAAAACLELGNWEAAQGKTAEAAGWFERLVRESPHSPYIPAAYYNLALLRLGKQDIVSARAAFFHVIDYAPGHELALKAYIRVGQSHLEEDDASAGIFHLRHAQTTAPNSAHHGHATVALAAGYLLNNQPDRARTVLAKERTLLQKSHCKATAAFLDAYAQFQLAKESSQARREASDLLGTLLRDQDKTVLGPLGNYLVAHSYVDLGFFSHAEQLLREADLQARGTLAKAVEFSLADVLLKQQRRKDAETLFVKVASAPSSYRTRAKFQLAQLRLQDKQFKKCAEQCRALWADRALLDSAAVLQVWGAALEGMGEFARAAQCFAGKAPD